MARIPDEEIERLKREIAIERLVTGFGVELKRAGANLVGRCPFTTTVARSFTTARTKTNAPSTPPAANSTDPSRNPGTEPVSYPHIPRTRLENRLCVPDCNQPVRLANVAFANLGRSA